MPPNRKRDGERDKPPRPPNDWICFRKVYIKYFSSAEVSRLWAEVPQAVKNWWKYVSMLAKEAHAQRYPGYTYKPERKKPKEASCNVTFHLVTPEQFSRPQAKDIPRRRRRASAVVTQSENAATTLLETFLTPDGIPMPQELLADIGGLAALEPHRATLAAILAGAPLPATPGNTIILRVQKSIQPIQESLQPVASTSAVQLPLTSPSAPVFGWDFESHTSSDNVFPLPSTQPQPVPTDPWPLMLPTHTPSRRNLTLAPSPSDSFALTTPSSTRSIATPITPTDVLPPASQYPDDAPPNALQLVFDLDPALVPPQPGLSVHQPYNSTEDASNDARHNRERHLPDYIEYDSNPWAGHAEWSALEPSKAFEDQSVSKTPEEQMFEFFNFGFE